MTRMPDGGGISLAICTHNGSAFIREQLESVLAQTVLPSEIILSDDASSDDTCAIAEDVVKTRLPLRIIRNRAPLGVSANFEQAVRECSGEFIALCDQDDRWHPEKLESIIGVFADRPGVALVHTDARLVSRDGLALGHSLLESLEIRSSEIRDIHRGRSFSTLLRRNLVTGATTVFRSSLLAHALPFPQEWVHDEWLAIVAAATATTELVERELIDYRQHGGNQIGARKLSFRQKLSKFREPRAERNEHLFARATTLTARLDALGSIVDPRRLELARGKLRHESSRLALPESRLLRILPIARAALAGRYSRFSLGLPDVLRDLAQPAR